ncbi:energy-coupling factor ABC transporter substrate-binding protein [Paludicola sp. MB14-C6]|uniref:energy-coupling factor ABC transporter substrate-binding protein n=1 Tax=Paludihabitans sp. MB14-C6 TaxID=3070656 RepID=UPI0027DABED4|nr:energy-coupling factor ABC transporter substrate-binding protein [Paludicola sp. MB14-C6]WMJ22027.1 energy-coupling factor ABC transporter substrate-binding protein [Paludicola sp. MB14-C6]
MSMFKKNLILIIIAVVIAVVPLVIFKNAEFAGADGLAEEAITKIDPNYKPWFEPIIELPSGEVESLLFCTQAAIGAGIMGFIFGRMTAKPKKEEKDDKNR